MLTRKRLLAGTVLTILARNTWLVFYSGWVSSALLGAAQQ